jgi:hypothetical protein
LENQTTFGYRCTRRMWAVAFLSRARTEVATHNFASEQSYATFINPKSQC